MIESYDGVAPFKVAEFWSSLPESDSYSEVSDVAVDGADRVYLLTRGLSRVIVYDRNGEFVTAWGEDVLSARPHGLSIAGDGSLYVVDEGAHQIVHFDSDGRILAVIGTGRASNTGHDFRQATLEDKLNTISASAGPFNLPTAVVEGPRGDLYATDGYGNARVHRFERDTGRLLQSWGEPGTGEGQFRVPHGLVVASGGRVIVADRENDRLQVFDLDGAFVAEWRDVQRPSAIAVDFDGNLLVAEIAWFSGERSFRKGMVEKMLPARLSLLDGETGAVLGRWSEVNDGSGPGGLLSPHGIALDSAGNLYVGEVNASFGLGRSGVATGLNKFQRFRRA